MNSYLISKYSQSTHYHYKKGINDLLDGKRCQLYIQLKDHQCYDTQQEHLNKYYTLNQLKDKLKMLVEYYKYHNDIPRIFMIPAIISLNYYHDRKRRLEYYRIAKLIQRENLKNPDKPQKGIVGDTPLPLTSELLTAQEPSSSDEILSKNDKILQGITFLIEEPDSIEQIRQQIQSMVKMKKQPNNSSTKINSIASNTTTSKSNKQSILKQSTKLSKSPPLKTTLIEGISPRVPKSSKHISPPNIKTTKPKSPFITSPVQQFMKLSASMKQQFQKFQCVSARANNNNNTTTFRKGSVTHILNILKSPTKNKSQQIQHISQTPRDQESKRSFNNNNKKVHQLELQVMSDLQNLLQKKTCLTHRSSMNKQNNNIKKKLNTRELNQFKCIRLPLSNREINNQKKE